jgi:hypothetical protein
MHNNVAAGDGWHYKDEEGKQAEEDLNMVSAQQV